MAISFKAGIFQKQSGIGLQNIIVGFRPKLVLFSAVATALNTFQANTTIFFGFADSSDDRSFGVGNEDNSGSEQARSHWHTAQVWSDSQNGSSFQQTAIMFTFESDGFNLFFHVNNSVNYQISYIALGGTDIDQTEVGHFTAPSSPGIHAVSGIGFRPDLVFLLGTNHTSDNVAKSDRASFSFGAFNSLGQQGVSSVIMVGNVSPTNTARYQRTNRAIAMFSISAVTPTMPSTTHEASFSSMNSNGFSLNYSKASGSGKRVAYVAIKGISSFIGSLTSPTAGNAQTLTDLGSFIPRGLILFSDGAPANTVPIAHCRFSMGAANSSSSRWANWAGDKDNVSNAVTATHADNDEILRISDEAATASSSTTQALADFSSMSTGQFTLLWPTIDTGNAYQVIYVFIGDKPSGPTLYTRSITDPVSINTTVEGGKLRTRAVTAALTVASAVSSQKLGIFPAIINEFIAIAALVSKRKSGEGEFEATIAEFVQIQTTPTRLRSMSRSVSDEVLDIADALTRRTLISRSLAATTIVSSFVVRLRMGLGDIFINESVAIADSIERLRTARKTIDETIEVVTTPMRRLTANREIAELVTVIGNLINVPRSVFFTFNEFVTVSSALVRQRFIFRFVNESVTINASLARLRTIFKTLTENVEINTSATRILFAFRQASIALTSVAGVVRLRIVSRELPQSLTISDSLTRIAFFFRSISESLNVAAGLRFFIVGTVETLTEELGRFWTQFPHRASTSKVWNILKRIPNE